MNTLKTILGFLLAFVEKHTPLTFSGSSIEDIYNYLNISEQLATSGQPTERQFIAIQKAGYQAVVNLAPNSVLENSLKTEASLLGELGIEYIHIPVDFSDPTAEDFSRFVDTMQAAAKQKVWVHCAANMRVSAFVYKYRTRVLGEATQDAGEDLARIWQPFGVWKKFLA